MIGASDCEEVSTGLIAQPFNTWSSAAYVVAGGWIIVRRRAWRLDRSAGVFGGLVILTGLGSLAFHAAADPTGRWLHDLSLVGTLGFVAGWHLARLCSGCTAGGGRLATIAGLATLLVMGVVLRSFAEATNAAVVLLVAAALVAFVVHRIRTGTRPSWGDVPFVAVAVLALAAFLLGRTGSPACDEDSVLQLHGLWHIATAVLAVIWARGALRSPRWPSPG